jgi:hypothetical protein
MVRALHLALFLPSELLLAPHLDKALAENRVTQADL